MLSSLSRKAGFAVIALGLAVLALPASQPASAQMQHQAASPGATVTVGNIVIADPWIKEPPAGAEVSGGYMIITNNGKESDRLIAASIPEAGKTEVHEMVVKNNIMRMRELDKGLEIKPGETATLKPGSFHLMFLKLKRLPAAGETITGEVVFEKAGKAKIEFPVRKMTMQPAHNMQGQHGKQ